ncbi:hypothetical protein EV127DRAFT_40904 [Xylaria flabelliformis]|nr:hypothetical protein EV127DRAFT_40904 [Xylaria flabelliformis]
MADLGLMSKYSFLAISCSMTLTRSNAVPCEKRDTAVAIPTHTSLSASTPVFFLLEYIPLIKFREENNCQADETRKRDQE